MHRCCTNLSSFLIHRRFFSTSFVSTESTALGTQDFSVHFSRKISPWHDIPLFSKSLSDGTCVVNMVNEIPMGTFAKNEIHTKIPFNPIKQDVSKTGALRYLLYSKSGVPFNYGCLPQTWEGNSAVALDEYNLNEFYGDNDPLDVVDISGKAHVVGAVRKAVILGSLALIDEGEIDWKIICYSFQEGDEVSMEKASQKLRNEIDSIRNWFINYKTAEGKAKNVLAEDAKLFDGEFTKNLVKSMHGTYRRLIDGDVKNTSGLWLP